MARFNLCMDLGDKPTRLCSSLFTACYFIFIDLRVVSAQDERREVEEIDRITHGFHCVKMKERDFILKALFSMKMSQLL